MRILHLDPDDIDNPLSGGGPVRTHEIYRRLAHRHEIVVLTPTFAGSTPTLEREGVRYIRLGRKVGNHGSSHHLTFLASLPKAVRRFDYDILIEDLMPPCSSTWTPWFARRDRPLIASVQWFFAREYTRRLLLPFHWGEEYGIRMYRNFIVLTHSMQSRIESRHPRANCRLVPNGVSDALFTLTPHAGDFMLYVGRLEINAKGLDLLLQALALVPEALRMPLVVAGSGHELQEWDRLLSASGLRPWVRCVGHVDAIERDRLLQASRFLVMPSRIETFGMTIAEANAAATPVIVWDRAPMSEVAAPSSVRVPAFDTAALAQAMLSLSDASNEAIVTLGMQARGWARRYDWASAAGAQEDFYLGLVAAKGTGQSRPRPSEIG
jgi:glycosyltransferase involved in cell wall biosynthesis